MDLGKVFHYLANRKDWRPVKNGQIIKSKPLQWNGDSTIALDICDVPSPRLVARLAVALVEEQERYYKAVQQVLRENKISPADFEAVKKKLED